MTPFLQFRVWWGRSAPASRVATVTAGFLVLALLVWIAIPPGQSATPSAVASNLGSPGAGSSTAAGSASASSAGGSSATPAGLAGSSGGGAGGGAGVGSGGGGGGGSGAGGGSGGGGSAALGSGSSGLASSGSGPAGSGSGGSGASGSGSTETGPGGTSATTTAPCATPTKVPVGVVLDDVAGLNSTFGIPSPSGQEGEYNAVFAAINTSRSAGCRMLVPDFQTYNEFDSSTAESTCLTFAQHKDFAVLNGYLPTGTDDCVLQHHIPLFEIQPIAQSDVQTYNPYYFTISTEYQRLYRNFTDATAQMGVWQSQNGFEKLGILYRDCQPDVNSALLTDLAAVGVPSSRITRFDVGCPDDFASPTAIEQAVLQFKAAGVTTVTVDNDLGDLQNLTKVAEVQAFHPRWVIPDNGIVGETGSVEFTPDPDNFNNALAITPFQYGATNSGLPETAGTQQCNQVMAAGHQPTVLQSGSAAFAGVVCSVAWMFAAALANDPSGAADELAAGLQKAGTSPVSYPFGPASFTTAGTTFGGEDWRPVTFHGSCQCWKVDNATFQPPF